MGSLFFVTLNGTIAEYKKYNVIISTGKEVIDIMNKPDVFNLHFTDYCNYKCCYCFVEKKNNILDLKQIEKIVDHLSKYFISNNLEGRINLVGGEPLTYSNIQDVIDYINKKKIKISIVTNGSLLSEQFIIHNKYKVDTIGISVDSLVHETNIKIGRCSNNNTLSKNELIKLCKLIKDNGIKLKINLCLSKLNKDEDISDFIKIINPNRFKIFQMTIINGINITCRKMQLSDSEFSRIIQKYLIFNPVIEYEKNMKSSYLMIDSKGDLYYDKEQKSVCNLINDTMDNIRLECLIDNDSFNSRYDN